MIIRKSVSKSQFLDNQIRLNFQFSPFPCPSKENFSKKTFFFIEIFIFWDGIYGIHQLWVPKTRSQTGCLWWTESETETTLRTQRPGFKIQCKLNSYFALKLWFIIDDYITTILVNHHTLSSCQKIRKRILVSNENAQFMLKFFVLMF